VVSTAAIENWHVARLPAASVAVHVTGVPEGPLVPVVHVTAGAALQLSVAETPALGSPVPPHSIPVEAGHVSTGGIVSTIATVASHDADSPESSVHVSVTRRVPAEYGPPGVCVHVKVSPVSGSYEPSFTEAFWPPHVESSGTVTLRQRATGGRFTQYEAHVGPSTGSSHVTCW
jgi:hypothetical protein